MTVLETELSTSHPARFSTNLDKRQELERLISSDISRAALICPNINQLDMPHFQKADHWVHQLGEALLSGQADVFNEIRQHLVALLKKHAEPVTQWSPLVLELSNAEALQGLNLSQMNFSMTRLQTTTGPLSLKRCNLQNANLLCADMSQVTLIEADLSGSDCRYADFRDVNLSKSILVEADLSHAKLSLANLQDADLYCAKLNSSLLKETCLNAANLRKTDLRNADLYQADLRNARLQHTDLREANLFTADLSGAKLRQADLRKAHLSFCSLKEARLPNARLEGANLTNSDLAQADLQKCRFAGSLLNRARFTEAKVNLAHLQGTDLSEVIELDTAMLQGAMFDQDTIFPKGFKPRKHALMNARCFTLKNLLRWVKVVGKSQTVSEPLVP